MQRLALGLVVFLAACSSDPASSNVDGTAGIGGTAGVAGSSGRAGTAGSPGGSAGSGGSVAASGAAGSGGQGGAAAGGTQAGGGSGGQPLPIMPGTCDGLGAVGAWQEITPPGIFAAMFIVDPVNLGTVYAGSGGDDNRQGVFKTTDCGANWIHISTGENGAAIDSGVQWTMAIDPTDPQILYTNSGFGANGLYKSTNGGVDWQDIMPQGDGSPGFAGNLQMDPEDPKHLLLSFHNNCGNYADGIGCFAETRDGGATWKEHYGTPKWPGQVRPLLLHGDTWLILGDTFLLTRDAGETFESLLGESIGGHSSGTLSRMKNGDYFVGYTNGLIRSPAASDGGEWSVLANTGAYGGDIVENATTRFSAHQTGPWLTSPISDGVTWTPMDGSPHGEFAGYDPYHHLLYGAADGKLSRVVTE